MVIFLSTDISSIAVARVARGNVAAAWRQGRLENHKETRLGLACTGGMEKKYVDHTVVRLRGLLQQTVARRFA
jgi:hypothetical protein